MSRGWVEPVLFAVPLRLTACVRDELRRPVAAGLRRVVVNLVARQCKRLRLAFIGADAAAYAALRVELSDLAGLIGQLS